MMGKRVRVIALFFAQSASAVVFTIEHPDYLAIRILSSPRIVNDEPILVLEH
jgi:hypothetical protein